MTAGLSAFAVISIEAFSLETFAKAPSLDSKPTLAAALIAPQATTLDPATAPASVQPQSSLVRSPVQIIDYREFGTVFNDSAKKSDLKALLQLSFIIYDKIIERPWGDLYLPEANARLQTFRKEFCESGIAKSTCGMPKQIQTELDLYRMISNLNSSKTLKELQNALAPNGGPVQFKTYNFDKISYLEQESPGSQPNEIPFNIFLSAKDKKIVRNDLRVWNMTAPSIEYIEKEYILAYDVAGYRGGFFQQESHGYLFRNADGKVLVNVDALKQAAMKFAAVWKFKVEKLQATQASLQQMNAEKLSAEKLKSEKAVVQPPSQKIPNVFGFDDQLLVAMVENNQAEFQKITLALVQRLALIQTDFAKETFLRFQEELQQGKYPEEVYQFASYAYFNKLIQAQAEYFSLSLKQRDQINFKRKVLESLLYQQTVTDPHFLLYQVYSESIYQTGSVLGQFVNPSVGYTYFFEFCKAVLGIQEYADVTKVSGKYLHLINHPDLVDPQFLGNFAPEALEILKDSQTHQPRSLSQLTKEEQNKYWLAYLFDSEHKPRPIPVYRMGAALIILGKAAELKELAQLVWTTRKSEFVR